MRWRSSECAGELRCLTCAKATHGHEARRENADRKWCGRYNHTKLQAMRARQASQAQQEKDAERAEKATESTPILQNAMSGGLHSKSPKTGGATSRF